MGCSPADPTEASASSYRSKTVPGPPGLRHYAACQLVAWQPRGAMDDKMLKDIADWLVTIEKVSLPFKRYVDLNRLQNVAGSTRHVFDVARRRAEEFAGTEPVRT